jgi:hypothetical protein
MTVQLVSNSADLLWVLAIEVDSLQINPDLRGELCSLKITLQLVSSREEPLSLLACEVAPKVKFEG